MRPFLCRPCHEVVTALHRNPEKMLRAAREVLEGS